jgi:hypothetical protein
MDYQGLIKRLELPGGGQVPTELTYGDVRAVALTREYLDDDVRGINDSIELIRKTRGGRWPTEPVTADFDYVDLVWHECEFRNGDSFTYAVYAADAYIGCVYLYPMGRRRPLTDERVECDVDASWWVTPDAYAKGYYAKVYVALKHWFETELPFSNPDYSNVEIP